MFLVIDGGTTNLRVTLLDEKQKPVDAVKEDGGVRHTAVDGNNQYLKTTLRACIDRLLARNGLGAGDGQVTMGESTIFKATAHKVRRIFGGKVVTGFAGTVSDAFALCDRFEAKLEQFSGNLERAAVELAQEWRSDKAMRKLEAMLIVASGETLMIVSGTGEVIEPDDGIAAVGSGGNYAMAAARALKENTDLSAHEIAEKALHIAADICVFTNHNVIVEDA